MTRPAATRKPPLVNRLMALLLRSRFSGLADRGVMLLTVKGRRTGRPYTFPVQYVHDDSVLWVFVGDEAAKTWWRNVVGGADVQVLLRGSFRSGRAVALRGADEPEHVGEGLRHYAGRFPRTAKRLGLATADAGDPAEAASRTVMVRIELR